MSDVFKAMAERLQATPFVPQTPLFPPPPAASTPVVQDGDPNAPNKPDEWIRLGRRGDYLTIWRHIFHPTLSTHILFEGRYDDPAVGKILSGLDSLTPPAAPQTPEAKAAAVIEELSRKDLSPDVRSGLEQLRDCITKVCQPLKPTPANWPSIDPSIDPVIPKIPESKLSERRAMCERLRRHLLSTDRNLVESGARALSEFVNAKIGEEHNNKMAIGLLTLNVPITDGMIPSDTSLDDPRVSVLKALYDLFYKLWDCHE